MITVVNKYKHIPTSDDFYIGRGSVLGNPYSHKTGTKAIDIVETREIAIMLYKEWIQQKIKQRDNDICHALNELYFKAIKSDVNLVCYCKPKACHGDILKEIIKDKITTK